MKFKDLMLDLATGDASPYDAYIEESVGKIKVSNAIFEASSMIMEAADQQVESDVIVEAAEECGLPISYQEAQIICESACGRAIKQVPTLCKQIAADLTISSDKKAKGMGAVNAFMGKNGKISKNPHILDIKDAKAFAESYKDCMQTILNTYSKSTSVNHITAGLIRAAKLAKVAPVGRPDPTFGPNTAKQIQDCLYDISETAKAVAGGFGDMSNLKNICDGASDSEMAAANRAAEKLAVEIANLRKSINKQFGDTLAYIGEKLAGSDK